METWGGKKPTKQKHTGAEILLVIIFWSSFLADTQTDTQLSPKWQLKDATIGSTVSTGG